MIIFLCIASLCLSLFIQWLLLILEGTDELRIYTKWEYLAWLLVPSMILFYYGRCICRSIYHTLCKLPPHFNKQYEKSIDISIDSDLYPKWDGVKLPPKKSKKTKWKK